jgi:hypothetical protein
MEIFRVRLSYNSKTGEASLEATPIEVKEGKTVYILERESGKKHIRKTDVDNMVYSDVLRDAGHSTLGIALIYCHEKDVEFVKRMMAQDVISRAYTTKINADATYELVSMSFGKIAGVE